jgi:hypothetical protein
MVPAVVSPECAQPGVHTIPYYLPWRQGAARVARRPMVRPPREAQRGPGEGGGGTRRGDPPPTWPGQNRNVTNNKPAPPARGCPGPPI